MRRAALRVAVGALLAIGALAFVAALPDRADAQVPIVGIGNPLDLFDAASDAVKGTAVASFGAILDALFGGIQAKVTAGLITWLVAIPNFTGTNVTELQQTVTAMAVGLLAAVMTLAIVRYWLAGLTGGGGGEAVDGLTRSVGATLFIVVWPWLFTQAIALTNAGSAALLHGNTTDDLTVIFRAAITQQFTLGGGGWIISIIIALAGTLLLLALVVMKIVLSASTALLFVGMPLAAILWPVSELSWVMRTAARGLAVCLIAPVLWVVIFALAAAMSLDAIEFQGGTGVLDAVIIRPLTGCALLYGAVAAPRFLMRAAMMGATPGGGFVARTASHVAGRMAASAIGQQIPVQFGGSKQPAPPPPTPKATMSVGDDGRMRTTFSISGDPTDSAAAEAMGAFRQAHAETVADNVAAAANTVSRPTPPAIPAKAGRWNDASAAALPADTIEGTATPIHPDGGDFGPGRADPAHGPAWNPQAFAAEHKLARETRAPSAAQVAEAYGALSPEQRKRAESAAAGGLDMRAHYAHEATAAHLAESPGQRQALRTLAAAPTDVHTRGVAMAKSAEIGAPSTDVATGGVTTVPPGPQPPPSEISAPVPEPSSGQAPAPAAADEPAPPPPGSTVDPSPGTPPPAHPPRPDGSTAGLGTEPPATSPPPAPPATPARSPFIGADDSPPQPPTAPDSDSPFKP
jgi:hypothetical protein